MEKTQTQRARFNHLAAMWQAAPLSKPELEELKELAKKFNPKMAEYIEKNPKMC